MDAYEALVTRVSPTEIGDPAPDDETLRKIVAAALRAPDHGRLHPWRFISIRGDGRRRLGGIFASALQRRDPKATPEILERERQKPLRGPLLARGRRADRGAFEDPCGRATFVCRRGCTKHHACKPRAGLRGHVENRRCRL